MAPNGAPHGELGVWMLLKLTVENAAAYIDIWASKRRDLALRRKSSARGSSMEYRIRSRALKSLNFQILVHRIRKGAVEITFPIRIPETFVVPSPRADGGSIEVSAGGAYEPVFRNRVEEMQYRLCRSIWHTLKLHEYLLQRRLGEARLDDSGLPTKPIRSSTKQQWFQYKEACDAFGLEYSLKALAADMSLSYGYTRKVFSNWKREKVEDEP
jgi:hypothetical protein